MAEPNIRYSLDPFHSSFNSSWDKEKRRHCYLILTPYTEETLLRNQNLAKKMCAKSEKVKSAVVSPKTLGVFVTMILRRVHSNPSSHFPEFEGQKAACIAVASVK